MGRRKKPLLESIEITGLAAGGKAIARVNEKVIFVTNVIPGDVVDVQVTKNRKSYMEGFPVRFHKHSPVKTKAFCEHFGVCGGCKWQNLPYNEQLKFKQQEVIDSLERIGKLELPEISPIIASANTELYRNKLEYTFSNKRFFTWDEMASGMKLKPAPALGFHVPKLFDKVVDINKCHLQPEPSNAIRLAVKDYALKNGLSFFDIRNQEGFLRTLIIRTSSTGEVMVIVVFYYEDVEKQNGLMKFLAERFPEITSLMYVINRKANDSISDLEALLFEGQDHIFERMEGLKFKIGPKSFYQTNSLQAYELYQVVRDFADLQGNEIVYDLYTGTGTIANFVAKDAKKVIGMEFVPDAIEDAKVNSNINNVTNTLFFAGDIRHVLTPRFLEVHGRPDVVITDPPRAGMHKDVTGAILDAEPRRVVYVSCNPATQARDIGLMVETYRIVKVQPVDMFPHTHHVENVVLLEKRQAI